MVCVMLGNSWSLGCDVCGVEIGGCFGMLFLLTLYTVWEGFGLLELRYGILANETINSFLESSIQLPASHSCSQSPFSCTFNYRHRNESSL